jgi:hypothetical protein
MAAAFAGAAEIITENIDEHVALFLATSNLTTTSNSHARAEIPKIPQIAGINIGNGCRVPALNGGCAAGLDAAAIARIPAGSGPSRRLASF